MSQVVKLMLWIPLTIGLSGINVPDVMAQSDPDLKDHQKAVIAFDIRLEKLFEGAEAAGFANLDEMREQDLNGPFRGIKTSELKRVFGAISLPASIEDAMQMQPGSQLPIEFFARFEFANSEACDLVFENFSDSPGAPSVKEIEHDGKTFLEVELDEGDFQEVPAGIVAHQATDTIFEVGTKTYCFRDNRSVFSDTLKKAWSTVPDDAIRIAIDLETRADLIADAVEMASAGAPPMVAPYLELLDNVKSLVVSVDLQQENLLTIRATGVNEDDAEEFQSALSSLLGMAKIAGKAGLGGVAESLPDELKVAEEILESLKATRDGVVVSVVVAKPAGFNEMVAAASLKVRDAAKQASKMNNFKQAVLAMLNYESAHGKLLFSSEQSLSWRVHVLPYIEEGSMYEQMDMEKGPDEAPNDQFADQMPTVYGDSDSISNISWIKSDVETLADITDGTSNTIVFLENRQGVAWLENNPLTIEEAVGLVLGLEDGETLIAAFYDGHASRLGNNIDEKALRNMFDPSDGELTESGFDMDFGQEFEEMEKGEMEQREDRKGGVSQREMKKREIKNRGTKNRGTKKRELKKSDTKKREMEKRELEKGGVRLEGNKLLDAVNMSTLWHS